MTENMRETGKVILDAIRPHLTEKRTEVGTPTRSALLSGTVERRTINEFELRDTGNGLMHFAGYAAVWDQPYTVNDWMGSFTEIVDRSALSRTLSRNPNVVLNINHGGLPLARTTSGTLRIGTDSHGYTVEADLEPRDPDVQKILYKLDRRDLEDMSWAFRVTVDEWQTADNGDETRIIKEVNVDGGDVSIVTNGANPGTTANPLRSAVEAFADFDKALVECRSQDGIDLDKLRAASENMGRLVRELSPRKTLSLRAAERALLLD